MFEPTNLTTRLESQLAAWSLLLACVLLVAIVSLQLLGLPDALGRYIPSQNLASDHMWATVLSVLGSLLIFSLPLRRSEAHALQLCWLAKCFVGLVAMLWYENYYSFLDSYSYFNEGRNYLTSPEPFQFGDGTNLTIHLSALLLAVLPGEFHTLKQAFSLIGLAGIYCFYASVCIVAGRREIKWLLGIGLFPSILFWTSTLGKDPVVFLGISFFVLGCAMVHRKMDAKALVLLVLGLLLAAGIRPWLSVIMAPSLILLTYRSRMALLGKIVVFSMVVGLIAISVATLADRFDFASKDAALERLDASARGWAGDGDSGQVVSANLSNPVEYLSFLPLAIFTTLFRPLPGEVLSLFGYMSGIENLLLLFLFARVVVRMRLQDLGNVSVQFTLIFLVSWLVLYAPVAYQNLGTAVRFKLQILPLFLVLLLYLGRKPSQPH